MDAVTAATKLSSAATVFTVPHGKRVACHTDVPNVNVVSTGADQVGARVIADCDVVTTRRVVEGGRAGGRIGISGDIECEDRFTVRCVIRSGRVLPKCVYACSRVALPGSVALQYVGTDGRIRNGNCITRQSVRSNSGVIATRSVRPECLVTQRRIRSTTRVVLERVCAHSSVDTAA